MTGDGWGMGSGWIFMVIFWAALIAVVLWGVVRLVQAAGSGGSDTRGRAETPQEILDRRFAAGEIDDEEYRGSRETLSESGAGSRRSPGTLGGAGLIGVVIAALVLLVATLLWAVSGAWGPGGGMMGGSMMESMMGEDMMGGTYALAGTGAVTTLAEAREAAERYADRLDLQVGEVMEFEDGFYAELRTPDGDGATEVLIDADDGDVRIEYGPAMMWNTEYGMHAAASTRPAAIPPEEARRLAGEWLATRDADLSAGEPEAFPGYYTLHTEQAGEVTGMLSVNAYSGAVWYHTWHGDFVAMDEG